MSTGMHLSLQLLRVIFSNLPHTNVIRSFSLISSTPTLTPNFITWLTSSIWSKECEEHLSLGVLQSIIFISRPLDLPGQRTLWLFYQRPTVLVFILGSPPLLPLRSACALLRLPFCTPGCVIEKHREMRVGRYKLWVSQSWAALCRCLPAACYESSESCRASTYFSLEIVPTAHLVCLIVLRL